MRDGFLNSRRTVRWSPVNTHHRLVSLSPAVVAVLTLLFYSPLPAQDYTLEQIRKGYLENISKIVTLQVKWHETSEASYIPNLPPLERDLTWHEDGKKWRLDLVKNDAEIPRDLTMTDGNFVWGYSFVRGQTKPLSISEMKYNEPFWCKRRQPNEVRQYMGGVVLPGSKSSLGALTLIDLLASGNFTVVGEETLFEFPQVLVSCNSWEEPNIERKLKIDFHLDPAQGFVPRRFRVSVQGENSSSGFDVPRTMSCEFPGGQVFLPELITKIHDNQPAGQIHFREVQINAKIATDLFRPDSANRSLIVSANNAEEMLMATQRVKEARAKSAQELGPTKVQALVHATLPPKSSDPSRPQPTAAATLNASPTSSSWWRWPIFGVGALLLGWSILLTRSS